MTTSLHFYSLTQLSSTDVTSQYPLINSYSGSQGLDFSIAQCYGGYFDIQLPYQNTVYLTGTQTIILPNTPGNLIEFEFYAENDVGFIGISTNLTTWYRVYGNASSSTGSTNTSTFSGKYSEEGQWGSVSATALLTGEKLYLKVEGGYAGFRRMVIKSSAEDLPFFSKPINYNGSDLMVMRTTNTGEWLLGELKDGLKFSRSLSVNTTPRPLSAGNNSEVGEIGVHADRLVYGKTHVYGTNKLPPTAPVYTLEITQQPVDVTTNAGTDAVFSVTVSSVLPVSYLWTKDGSPLVGEITPSLTVSPVQFDDDSAEYACIVTDGITEITSDSATLKVLGSAGNVTTGLIDGTIYYWNSGNVMPAGVYRVTYITGAWRPYNLNSTWTVQHTVFGVGPYIKYNNGSTQLRAPGIVADYGSSAAAIAGNSGRYADFTHTGGTIGAYLYDTDYSLNDGTGITISLQRLS